MVERVVAGVSHAVGKAAVSNQRAFARLMQRLASRRSLRPMVGRGAWVSVMAALLLVFGAVTASAAKPVAGPAKRSADQRLNVVLS